MIDHPQDDPPQKRWANACAKAVDIAGRCSRGADLSIEMAEAFKADADKIAQLEAEIARLRDYVQHKDGCRVNHMKWKTDGRFMVQDGHESCTCGLTAPSERTP